MLADIEEGNKAGFDRYLTKPMMLNDIMDTISDYLES